MEGQITALRRRRAGHLALAGWLVAYGSAGTWRAPVVRVLLGPFAWYTSRRYARLARTIARGIRDYRRCGIDVVGLVGIGGSPSCGVRTTMDMRGALRALTRCPAARLDRRALNQDIVAANIRPGEGLFIRALRKRLARADVRIPLHEHDLLAELGIEPARAGGPDPPGSG